MDAFWMRYSVEGRITIRIAADTAAKWTLWTDCAIQTDANAILYSNVFIHTSPVAMAAVWKTVLANEWIKEIKIESLSTDILM